MTALATSERPDFAAARYNMVESQLRPNRVTDTRILDAMGSIPRELFVPSTLVGVAYVDDNLPLISGRSLMHPMALALLIQAAEIAPEDHVLELAPATGYSTLVLSALTPSVVSIEPDAILHKEAEKNVAEFAKGRAVVLAGAPVGGGASHAPYDVIYINGSVEFVPEVLFEQLSEGGRLVAVVKSHDNAHTAHVGEARLYRKNKGEVTWTALFNVNVPPAPGFDAPRGFTF